MRQALKGRSRDSCENRKQPADERRVISCFRIHPGASHRSIFKLSGHGRNVSRLRRRGARYSFDEADRVTETVNRQ